jgi:hypothetical protein
VVATVIGFGGMAVAMVVIAVDVIAAIVTHRVIFSTTVVAVIAGLC